MRRTHYLGLIAALAVTQSALIYGCSADAGAPIEDPVDAAQVVPDATVDDAPVLVEEETGTVIPDAGKKDTAVQDSAKEATTRADTGAPGTPCNPAGTKETQACGKCGTQSRLCESAVNDAGSPLWSIWGSCLGENTAPDACDPSQNDGGTEPCGNCGTRARLCQLDCKPAQGIVCSEPVNSCTPGDTKFDPGFGCIAPEGRVSTCGPTCAYGTAGACVTPPPNANSMTISATATGVVTKKFTFSASKKLGRLSADRACPTTILTFASAVTPYIYVELKNPTNRAVNVSVWHTPVTGGAPVDTIMAAYAGPTPPQDTDTVARQNCVGWVSDECESAVPTSCSGSVFAGAAGLMTDDVPPHAVSIPALGSITIYSAPVSATSVGDFNLNTRTEN